MRTGRHCEARMFKMHSRPFARPVPRPASTETAREQRPVTRPVPPVWDGSENAPSPMEKPMLPSPGLLVWLVGVGMMVMGWLLFRRPGVAFWTWAAIWEGHNYLKPPGVMLWAV